ncbi:MAG: hypothetical protein HOO93_02000 [Methyloglobulus sp.]|nr:hypothetical protein [Methyloglobulus sp.]
MSTDEGLWARSAAWRWTFVLTCLASAMVVLLGPWNRHIPISASLATYNPATNTNSNTKAAITNKLVGFHDTTFDVPATQLPISFPSGTELHVIGVYEGTQLNGQQDQPWWAKCKGDMSDPQVGVECHKNHAYQHNEKNVAVTITRSIAPIVLALMAYEPVKWKVIITPEANIQKIILSGYYGQDIEGVKATMPVEVYSNQSSPCTICIRKTDSFFAYKEGSPELGIVVDKLKAITGLSPTSFQGAYRSDRFFITNSINRLSITSITNGTNIHMDSISGKYFEDRLSLGDISIPLPDGHWRGITYTKNPSNRGSDELAILAKIEKNQLEELIAVRAIVATDGKGFLRQLSCEAKDLHSQNVEINEAYDSQRCYWVNYTTDPWIQPIFALAANHLVSLGIPTPDLLINSAFHKADKNSALTVYYLTNPETKKISSLQTDWFASQWHPKNIKRFPEKVTYIQDRVRWAETWFQIFKATQ